VWTVEFLIAAANERAELPDDMRARLSRIIEVIESHGLDQLPRDWVKPLQGKLWELRFKGRDGIARALYVTARGQRVVVVRIFIKKTQKTPNKELALAKARAKELE
jgi:phage-related protein